MIYIYLLLPALLGVAVSCVAPKVWPSLDWLRPSLHHPHALRRAGAAVMLSAVVTALVFGPWASVVTAIGVALLIAGSEWAVRHWSPR